MTITSKNYTKHYYAGSERIATVIGGGGLDSMVHSTSVTPTQEELTVKAGFLNHYLHHQDPFLYDGVVDTVIPTEDIRGVYDPNLQYGCPSVILDTIAMKIYPDILLDNITYYGRFRDNEMSSVYFTHSDHLGSTSWITNCTGTPYQYLHYAPYGEMIANQTPYGYDERFKFIDKERDEESGYDYFGERYFYSTFNHWLSVDPMSDKYPNISPYAYCNWNPICFIDPDGEDWIDPGDGNISWNDKATSQEAMNKAGIQGVYLGKNVLVGKHGRDNNLSEKINGAIFELYLETNKEGPTASITGNTIPCDVDKYGTLKEGCYPAVFQKYHGRPAIYIKGDLPTVKGNPNNQKNYIDQDINKPMIPVEQHIMNGIYFHFGNNYFEGLKDSNGIPWTTGCQTGGNYKGSWKDYDNFMQNIPVTFNGWYYLRSR